MGICTSKSRREINPPSPPVTLPDDLIAEVLSFLDVKSLVRLKCVSKSWYSLISDPLFVNWHLHKSSSQKSHLTVFYSQYPKLHPNFTAFSIHHLLQNQSRITNYYMTMNNEHYTIVGSCNGLICLLHDSKTDEYRDFSLRFWNPAMRSLLDQLSCSIRISCNNDSNESFRFSFAYDNLTNKYKVVAFRPSDVRVFTLGDKYNNVWRNIQSFPVIPYLIIGLNGGVYVSNSLVWFALPDNVYYDYDQWDNFNPTVDQCMIISLDLGTETYTQLLPPRDFDQVPVFMPIVSVLMNCLCFSHCSKESNFIMWQMREFRVEASWTKLFKFSYQNLCHGIKYGYCHLLPLHFFGDSLILASNTQQVVLYNRRENKVDARSSNTFFWFFAKHYVESLVSTF